MKRALLAIAALITSSFTPVAPPGMVGEAVAIPAPNVLLCNDTSLLGSSRSGQFWGNPYLLPVNITVTTEFEGPFGSGDTQYFVATSTTVTGPIRQRCPVMNWGGKSTGKYQDVELAPAGTEVETYQCQLPLTEAGEGLGYVLCPFPPAGNTVRGRKPPTE